MFDTVKTELPRDRWGRPLITPPEGGTPVAYTRVTTFVKALDDTFHLNQWKLRMVALGMARRRDLCVGAAAITDPKDKSQKRTLQGIAEEAMQAAGAGGRATIGTALHSFSELVDQGLPFADVVPEEFLPDLAAYAKAMEPFISLDIEGFCVRDDLKVGGTYDRILQLPDGGLTAPDGTLVTGAVIGDLKTGDNVTLGMGAIAQQLGVYANSLSYDHSIGSRTELVGAPSKKWGIVVHLPAGTGTVTLRWVDIEAGWIAASEITPRVNAYRKSQDSLSFEFATFSGREAVEPSIVQKIHAATSYADLKAIHAAHRGVWTSGLTSLAASKKAELEAA